MKSVVGVICLFSVAFLGCASASCTPAATPQVLYSSSASGVLAAVPFIAEVSVSCAPPGPLYARVGTRTLPAVRIPGDKFQVSWTEEISEAASGNREIHLYTEAGYTALRKAMRSDQDITSVPSLATVVLSHSTGYNGPMINSEIMAAVMSVVVAYIALTNKSRLLS